jgi:hypothetical protein
MRPILDSRFWILGLAAILTLPGCSAPYEVRLSDGRSIARGTLRFFGWTDPPLVPGTRLVDARPGQLLVLWNEGIEAIVDVGEECPVLVRDGEGARAPSPPELEMLAAVLPGWPLVPAKDPARYAEERRPARRFPSHLRSHFEGLDPKQAVDRAIANDPPGWMELGGRVHVLAHTAARAGLDDLRRILRRGAAEGVESDRRTILRAVLARPELAPGDLRIAVEAGLAALAVAHPAADESVCLAALEAVAREPLSSTRRAGLEATLASPGVTPRVREKALEVPLAYPEDRDAIRALVK